MESIVSVFSVRYVKKIGRVLALHTLKNNRKPYIETPVNFIYTRFELNSSNDFISYENPLSIICASFDLVSLMKAYRSDLNSMKLENTGEYILKRT